MSFSDVTYKKLADGDGATVDFTFPFKIFSDADISVYILNETSKAAALQVLDTDYTVSINSITEGGTVSFTTAPASTEKVLIVQTDLLTQPTSFTTESNFPEQSIDNELDRSRMIAKMLQGQVDRCLKIPLGSEQLDSFDPDLPILAADKYLKVDAAGTAFELVSALDFGSDTNPMTTAGDSIVGAASGVPARLALGAADEVRKVNSAGTAQEWGTLDAANISANAITPSKLGSFQNLHGALPPDLVVKYVTAATIDIDWTKGGLFVSDGTSVHYIETGDLTVDIAASGANGLDTGAEQADTWYYLWVIYNGTTVAGLISASSTAPTLPSGYTFKRLIGAARNDSSSDFYNFEQIGNFVRYDDPPEALNTSTYQSALTDLDLSSLVPPISRIVELNVKYVIQHTSAGSTFILSLRTNGSSASGQGVVKCSIRSQVANVSFHELRAVTILTDASQVIEYGHGGAAAATTQDTDIFVEGFYLQI